MTPREYHCCWATSHSDTKGLQVSVLFAQSKMQEHRNSQTLPILHPRVSPKHFHPKTAHQTGVTKHCQRERQSVRLRLRGNGSGERKRVNGEEESERESRMSMRNLCLERVRENQRMSMRNLCLELLRIHERVRERENRERVRYSVAERLSLT